MSSLIQPAQMPRVRAALERALPQFDAHAAVFDVVGERLIERLDVLAARPRRILELGCRTGRQLRALAERYPEAELTGVDPAPGAPQPAARGWASWLRGPARRRGEVGRKPALVAADPHRLPFADGSFDLVVSNLLLPWCHAPRRVFAECARVLDTGGAFFFSSAGPDTLQEYRRAWATVDAHLHAFGLVDMHDVGDAMLAAGFAAPVLDREDLKVDYPSVDALEAELRAVGAVNLASGRRTGLMAPSARKLLLQSVAVGTRFPVTLELVQGHGWKGELRRGGRADGEVRVPLDGLRASLRR